MQLKSSLAVICSVFLFAGSVFAADPVSFKKDIAPILRDNCLACHGPKKAEGGYRVDSFERSVAEGDSGSAAFTAKADDSEGLRRILSDDVQERMPLEGDPLPKEQIELIKRWIAEGAKFDGPDPKASLASIIPPPVHPKPPETYPGTLPITSVMFSKDGKELLVGGYHEISVWNPADGKLIRRIQNIGQRVMGMDLNPAGDLLAIACGAPGKHGEIRLINPADGKLVKVLGSSSDVVLDVKFSPDGKRLAAGSAESMLLVFEVATGKRQLNITSHSDWVMAVAWSPDGKKLASASRDKTVKVFDSTKGELSVTYAGHGQPVKGVTFHPDGAEVYSAGGDKKVHRWKVADAKKSADIGFGDEVFKLPRGGAFLFASSADKTVRQYDAKSHKEIRQYKGHTDWALSVAFHETSKRIASGAFDGEVRVWNAEDGKQTVAFIAAPGLKK